MYKYHILNTECKKPSYTIYVNSLHATVAMVTYTKEIYIVLHVRGIQITWKLNFLPRMTTTCKIDLNVLIYSRYMYYSLEL